MPKSEKKISAEHAARWADQPFQPSHPNAGSVERDTLLRATHALEYIAAQLGQINATLLKLLPDQKKDDTP